MIVNCSGSIGKITASCSRDGYKDIELSTLPSAGTLKTARSEGNADGNEAIAGAIFKSPCGVVKAVSTNEAWEPSELVPSDNLPASSKPAPYLVCISTTVGEFPSVFFATLANSPKPNRVATSYASMTLILRTAI